NRAAERSQPRRLRVISEEEFISEIRGELAGVRQSAIRIDERQGELRERVGRRGLDDQTRRGQAQVSERLARQREAIDELLRRTERNGLNDEALIGLLQDAQAMVGEAGERSNEASEALEEAAQEREEAAAEDAEAGSRPLDDEEAAEIDAAQREVQEELEGLIDLLDRGEDAWVVRRRLDNLLEEQRALREATAQAARETTGRETSDLNPEELSELQRIVQRQQELAEQLRELTQEMTERSRELREADPTASQGMAQAAQTAREQRTEEEMQQAAEQAQQNQMAQAGQNQENAIEQLEEMREDLDRAERQRDEVLTRILASLIESIEGLIERQEQALAALAEGERIGEFDGLDEEMIRLNQNTLGVLDQAAGAGRELAPVADLLGRAGDAQSRAIVALRGAEVNVEVARDNEQGSLELLRQARDEAQRIQEQLQQQMQDRKRRELRRQYRDLLEQQVGIRLETEPLADVEDLSRRDRATVRKLGESQDALREALAEVMQGTEELSEAKVFEHAHRKLDEATGASSEALSRAEPKPSLPHQDRAIAMLQGLVQALRENERQDENEFSQGGGQGGQGGQQGEQPLIPPLAELRLLRQIQADIADRTRTASGDETTNPAAIGQEQRELGELGQDLIRRMQQQGGGAGGPG
ncbi:MAG: hypothetical protein VYC34_07460, partial [Planctomycetota bacterium]|nr:hypothetical protein [Planctomycetota bacterium]